MINKYVSWRKELEKNAAELKFANDVGARKAFAKYAGLNKMLSAKTMIEMDEEYYQGYGYKW